MAQLGVSRVAGLSSSVAKMVKGYRHVCETEARLVVQGPAGEGDDRESVPHLGT